MDAILVILGAIIGAGGSIVGGLVSANRQLEHARRERREAREEVAVREIAAMLVTIVNGAHRIWYLTNEGRDPSKFQAVTEWYHPVAK